MSFDHKPVVLPEVDTSPYPRRTYDFAESWAQNTRDWENVTLAYEGDPGNFAKAYHYLNGHPAFWVFHPDTQDLPANHCQRLNTEYGFKEAVELTVHKNVAEQTVVCLEAGYCSLFPDEYGMYHGHDPRIDTHALTFEQAVVSMARKVWDLYGNDRRFCDEEVARQKGYTARVAESGEADSRSDSGDSSGLPGESAGRRGHSRWRGSWVGDKRVGGDPE